jgi:hypothetical protein
MRAIRRATSFCSCSSFFSATISLRSSGKFAACAVPSRPRLISLLCRRRRSCRSAMRVLWRLSFKATSRKPVRMKLTRRRYTNPEWEKDFSGFIWPMCRRRAWDRCGYSSGAASFASTLKSSSVVVSPVTFAPLAISLRSRRMILPLRVFGSASAKRTSSGFAIAPMCLLT